jgi:hypothetical protein
MGCPFEGFNIRKSSRARVNYGADGVACFLVRRLAVFQTKTIITSDMPTKCSSSGDAF